MSRTTEEWRGKTDDAAIPARVKDRIFARCNGQCQECRKPLDAVNKPEFDHIIALINSGHHAEFNLHTLCKPCHGEKTKVDVAEKSAVYQRRSSHLGFAPKRGSFQSRGFPKAKPQHTATRPVIRKCEIPHCIFAALVASWMLIGLPITLATST